MSEPTKREHAAARLKRLFRLAAEGVGPGDMGVVEAIVDLIVDAAKEEIRAEMAAPPVNPIEAWYRLKGQDGASPGPTPLREELKTLADASWARNEEAYRYLARDGKDSHAEEDPGRCERCGEPFELIRPGKSQPTCECWGRDV